MIFERTTIYSLNGPYSIYFRMVICIYIYIYTYKRGLYVIRKQGHATILSSQPLSRWFIARRLLLLPPPLPLRPRASSSRTSWSSA